MPEQQNETALKEHPTVKALMEHQQRIGESDKVFARRYLKLAGSTWNLIRSGKYANMVNDLDPVMELCAAALAVLNDQADEVAEAAPILNYPHVRAALSALKSCAGATQNRLVVYLAPSGGGKSTLMRRVGEIYHSAAIRVEATETWRRSYFNAACAVAEGAGLTTKFSAPRQVEEALLDTFATEGRILVIDEAHYCGPEALNLLKLLLNKTTTRILIGAIPQLWERMEKSAYAEVQQLRRRTAAKIVIASLNRDDVRTFLKARLKGYELLGADEKLVVEMVCDSANTFGLFDTVERFCTELGKECSGRGPDQETARLSLNRVEALRS